VGLVEAVDAVDIGRANRLGSTTHVSVLDADGWACAVTSSNGEGSGVVVPGTGIHLNNVLGEEDLSPFGFHRQQPGVRLPSMMAPTAVLRDGVAELVAGSAGSNRIRSAVLQVIVNVLDRGMTAQEAVDAPRLHLDGDELYAEPGVPEDELAATGLPVTTFRAPNLFFGGCQAVARHTRSPARSPAARTPAAAVPCASLPVVDELQRDPEVAPLSSAITACRSSFFLPTPAAGRPGSGPARP
jgi:gamma-glutamyltranspeptidase/glutathione hydrolase